MDKQPRRNPTDSDADSQPVLVDQFLDHGLGLRPYCECGRSSLLLPADLQRFPRGTTLDSIKARLACKDCGAVGVTTAQVVSVAALGACPRG